MCKNEHIFSSMSKKMNVVLIVFFKQKFKLKTKGFNQITEKHKALKSTTERGTKTV